MLQLIKKFYISINLQARLSPNPPAPALDFTLKSTILGLNTMYIYFIFNTLSINVFLAISLKLQIITSQLNDYILSLFRKLVVDLLII